MDGNEICTCCLLIIFEDRQIYGSANAQIENRMMGDRVQEKAVVYGGSRLEEPIDGGADCAQWRKSCCGGACCDGTKLISPCCGTKHDEITMKTARGFDQSHVAEQRNTICRARNEPAGSRRITDSIDFNGYNSTANYCTNRMNMSQGSGALSTETGVCPAMMRNLPCTSYRESKCFGGDCCDGDTESEFSIETV